MKKFILKSLIWTSILCFGLATTFILLKARSDTKTTTDTNPNNLYVNEWDTLTATKRNTIADRNRVYDSWRFDVKSTKDTSTTNDTTRNYYTINHNLNTDKITIDVLWKTTTYEGSVNKYLQFYNQDNKRQCYWYSIKKIDNNSFYIKTTYNSACTGARWLWIAGLNATTWQYSVIARTF